MVSIPSPPISRIGATPSFQSIVAIAAFQTIVGTVTNQRIVTGRTDDIFDISRKVIGTTIDRDGGCRCPTKRCADRRDTTQAGIVDGIVVRTTVVMYSLHHWQ